MRTLYLECGMGAAGDMLTAALLELIPDRESFIREMNSLGLPGISVSAEASVKCGITGTHMIVKIHGEEEKSEDVPNSLETAREHHHEHDQHPEHDHHHDHRFGRHPDEEHDFEHDHGNVHPHEHEQEHGHHAGEAHHHHHASISEIETIIDSLDVSDRVKKDAKAVYRIIAEAESQVHGRPVNEIHFHEVGTMDAVTDVLGVCILMEMIAPEQVIVSPVHVGSGHVHCMHGILPVPAPATALILKGIPVYGGQVRGELCTPTGAALIRYFAASFGDRPVMTTEAIGYGMGKKDFEQANCVRAFLEESEGTRESITRLECNLDDMTGEDIGFAMEQLFAAGARDVYTQPIGMKKNRPGILFSVICLPDDADRLAAVMMKHTTTLGVRRQDMSRYVLSRGIETLDTAYGPVRIKTASGMGVHRAKLEYEDLSSLAKKQGLSLEELRKKLIGKNENLGL